MTKREFIRALGHSEFLRATPDVERHLLALFDDDTIDHQDLARAAASVVLMRDSPELLHALLRKTINVSYALEQRLIAMRSALLRRPDDARLIESLGVQAQNNGWIWVTPEDDLYRVAGLAAEDPLRRTYQRAGTPATTWGGEFDDRDEVTRAVREQYEEHPYPRWLSIYRPEPVDHEPHDALFAGCGTGRDTIVYALKHPRARVAGIDISAASLAYATRKAAELGATNVVFRQADLRELGEDERYDVITSVGVLHHLADPLEGLRALARHLRAEGTMTIGVYSREARAPLAEFRALAGDERDLRRARKRIFDALPAHRHAELESIDFFELGHFRDTLFHAHEVELSRDELLAMIDAAGLTVVSLEHDGGSMFLATLTMKR